MRRFFKGYGSAWFFFRGIWSAYSLGGSNLDANDLASISLDLNQSLFEATGCEHLARLKTSPCLRLLVAGRLPTSSRRVAVPGLPLVRNRAADSISHGQARDFHVIDCGRAVALLVLWSYSMWGSTYLHRGPDRQTVLCPWRTTSQVSTRRWSEDLRLERIRIGEWVEGVDARGGCLVCAD